MVSCVFDVNPYLDYPFYQKLRDKQLFKKVRLYLESVIWENGQNFWSDTIYMDSVQKAIL